MGRSATRVGKGYSSQCRVAAARSLCLCPVEAPLPCTPSTPASWLPCLEAITTMLTAVSSTQTTRLGPISFCRFIFFFQHFEQVNLTFIILTVVRVICAIPGLNLTSCF